MSAGIWVACLLALILFTPSNNLFPRKNEEEDYELRYSQEEHVTLEQQVLNDTEIQYYLKITVEDAECYSANTSSDFVVSLVAIDDKNNFLSATSYGKDVFQYDEKKGQYRHEGDVDCVPRADAVFIRFDSEPDDPWAIDNIDVRVHFKIADDDGDMYIWRFEHSVLLPCKSWLKKRQVYQIGPRSGLFIEHPYTYSPKKGQTIRVWI